MGRYLFQPFYEAVFDFINGLIKNPFNDDELPDILKTGGYDRKSLIRELIRNGVLSRVNAIKDSDRENVMYTTKYTFHRDGHYPKIKKMFGKSNKNTMKENRLDRIIRETVERFFNECTAGDCGGGIGGASASSVVGSGADGNADSTSYAFYGPLTKEPLRREIYPRKNNKKKKVKK